MLNMGTTQMNSLGRAKEDAFVSRMAVHLRDSFQRQDVAPDAAEPAIRAGIARARGWGVVYEEDLTLYLECMMILGPRFDTDPALPWASEILSNQALAGDAKMDLIDEHLFFGAGAPR